MRSGILGVILTALGVAVLEVTLHWYAASAGAPLANRFASAYLSRDPDNQKAYVAGVVDLVVPSIVLGIGLGFFGAAWPPRYLVLSVPLLAVGVIALFPFYAKFFLNGGAHWWSPVNATPVRNGDYVKAFMKALALCGVLAHGTRLATLHFRGDVEGT